MHERISVVQEPYDLFFAESAPLHVRHSSWCDELPLLSAGTAYGGQVTSASRVSIGSEMRPNRRWAQVVFTRFVHDAQHAGRFRRGVEQPS